MPTTSYSTHATEARHPGRDSTNDRQRTSLPDQPHPTRQLQPLWGSNSPFTGSDVLGYQMFTLQFTTVAMLQL